MDERHKHYEHHDDNEHHDHLESHEHQGDHEHYGHLESHKQVNHKQVKNEEKTLFSKPIVTLIVLAAVLILFNQYQINEIIGLSLGGGYKSFSGGFADLSGIDINSLKSTGHTLAAVFPVENIPFEDLHVESLQPDHFPNRIV